MTNQTDEVLELIGARSNTVSAHIIEQFGGTLEAVGLALVYDFLFPHVNTRTGIPYNLEKWSRVTGISDEVLEATVEQFVNWGLIRISNQRVYGNDV